MTNRFRVNIMYDLSTHPHSFWAKRFDTVAHIPGNSGTLCGSSAALLGNNYAPDLAEPKVCEKCLQLLWEKQNNINQPEKQSL